MLRVGLHVVIFV